MNTLTASAPQDGLDGRQRIVAVAGDVQFAKDERETPFDRAKAVAARPGERLPPLSSIKAYVLRQRNHRPARPRPGVGRRERQVGPVG